jgi:hypothetical protein
MSKIPQNTFAGWLIHNFDLKLAEEVLKNDISRVIRLKSGQFDFLAHYEEDADIYIIYKQIDRKNSRMTFSSNELDNGELKIKDKPTINTYIAYFLNNKLNLVEISKIESLINDKNEVDLNNIESIDKIDMTQEQVEKYNEVYEIYDNISPNDKNFNKNFKQLPQFEEIRDLIK